MNEIAATETPRRFRFSLRELFVAMAVASGALTLLVHDGPLPGLYFAPFVAMGGWYFLRGRRMRVVVLVALYAIFWVGLQFLGSSTSLRNRIVWGVGG